MNEFIREFVARLKGIATHDDLPRICPWIWDHQNEVGDTAQLINETLGLRGDYELKRDVPCLTVGSTKGLVVLAANPGWKAELNAKEDAYCRQSPENYADMTFNFFQRHPKVRDEDYARWWSRAMKFIAMLPDHGESDPALLKVPARWKYAHESKLIGGWELFPWHSSSDGLTPRVKQIAWLREFFCESIQAVLRLRPKLLFVASSTGYDLVRGDLLNLPWRDFELGPKNVKGCYARLGAQTEVVAIKLQIFANAFRNFTDQELFARVKELGSQS